MSRRTVARAALAVLGLLGVVALIAWTQRVPLLEAALRQGLEMRFGADRGAELEDGLHLALCGAGGPLPAPHASGPCVAVLAGDQFFVVDVGTDSPRNINRMGYAIGSVDGILLTHFHSDHIDGLGEMSTLRWVAANNSEPLPVHGPPGVQRVVDGFNLAYSHDPVYRHDHHGDAVAKLSGAGLVARPFRTPETGELVVLHDEGGLRIEALLVDHAPVAPAVGYRFTYKDRSLLVTGDTSQFDNITELARGVDLLVHDALAPNLVGLMNEAAERIDNAVLAKVTVDIPDYHASPVQAAQTARDAGVGHLLYYHIVPPLILPGQEELFLNGAEDVFPDYTIGYDGVQFSLPAGSGRIIQTRSGL